jgi:hypothetical protein
MECMKITSDAIERSSDRETPIADNRRDICTITTLPPRVPFHFTTRHVVVVARIDACLDIARVCVTTASHIDHVVRVSVVVVVVVVRAAARV